MSSETATRHGASTSGQPSSRGPAGFLCTPDVPTGGLVYQLVTGTDAPFFTGMGARLSVPIEYKLGGVSILLGPGTYSTTVVYTCN